MKSISLRLDDPIIDEIKEVAEKYNISTSDLIREGIEKVLKEKKNNIYYKLTNFSECSEEETNEIIEKLDKISTEDLKIVRIEREKI
ncbi:ribbon-helix-helix domain-containing protein [Fusobacterium ulcerans]|uniref:ribbon-helix-helix domain-containing protein n=1 Tax=Fusobacterium ulcerans TaxID=861 RepID=UPI001D0B5F56|nr:ribbon-helix-helix domain-containing protein [Fusobacterium ulcerans]MCB8564520.1 ribbon-helix-helix domain-containing protein [Fusobacterium ulcerans]MCB8648691.1 ribbon-helix-helix domain-containing protein [Fusobacterium ulcerans]